MYRFLSDASIFITLIICLFLFAIVAMNLCRNHLASRYFIIITNNEKTGIEWVLTILHRFKFKQFVQFNIYNLN